MTPNDSGIKLFVDDLRFCPQGWTPARTNTQAIEYLIKENVVEVSLDHDILVDRLAERQDRVETFRPVAYYIASMPKDKRPKVHIHTADQGYGAHMAKILGIDYEPVFAESLAYL